MGLVAFCYSPFFVQNRPTLDLPKITVAVYVVVHLF